MSADAATPAAAPGPAVSGAVPGGVHAPELSLRWLLKLLLAWTVGCTVLLAVPLGAQHGLNGPLDLELARDAGAFAEALGRDWRQVGPLTCDIGAAFHPTGGCVKRLRTQLMVDSLALVPGYVGLLLFLTLALGRAARLRRGVWLHAACVPAIAAGFFDIAENGMTGRAADDLLRFVLADETVRDVRVASLVKWGLIGASFAVLALLAWRARVRSGVHPAWLLPVGAAAAVVAAAALLGAAFGLADSRWLLGAALAPALLAVAVLAAWRLRESAVAPREPPAPGSEPFRPLHRPPPAAPPAA